MIVDRRKDSYDELQILAGDVRTRRRRANMVTTLLITGGIVGTVAYIATMNQQVDALAGEREELRLELQLKDNIYAELRAQVYERLAEHVAQIANGDSNATFEFPEDIRVSGIPNAIQITGPGSSTTVLPTGSQGSISNLVYIVDGSRRFPMAIGDVLWVPEAQFWVRLNSGTLSNGGVITRYEGNLSSPNMAAGGQEISIGDIGAPTELLIGARGNSQGVGNCLSMGLGPTTRPGFGIGYYDMDVRVFSNDDCGRRYRFDANVGSVVRIRNFDPWIRVEQILPEPGSFSIHTDPAAPTSTATGAPYNASGFQLNLPADDWRRSYGSRLCIQSDPGTDDRPFVDLELTDDTNCQNAFRRP